MKTMLGSEAYCSEIKLLAPKGIYSKITHLCNLKGSPTLLPFLRQYPMAVKYAGDERGRPLYSTLSFKME